MFDWNQYAFVPTASWNEFRVFGAITCGPKHALMALGMMLKGLRDIFMAIADFGGWWWKNFEGECMFSEC
jgi:hypothetical protein